MKISKIYFAIFTFYVFILGKNNAKTAFLVEYEQITINNSTYFGNLEIILKQIPINEKNEIIFKLPLYIQNEKSWIANFHINFS